MEHYDVVVIGGGGAGLIAALTAKRKGAKSVLVLERREELGGMLNFTLTNTFGKGYYETNMTGPEFIQRLIVELDEMDVTCRVNATVIELTKDREIKVISDKGVYSVSATAIIMATGYREKPRGISNIPGNKYAGVYTAASAQRFISKEGYIPGKEIVIFGSSDAGLVLAKRLFIEGAKIKYVMDVNPYIRGTLENCETCIENFNIPILLGTTILRLDGKERLNSITIAAVDDNKKPIKGTERKVNCDTLIISAIDEPESALIASIGGEINKTTKGIEVNESFVTSIEGIFAIGNVIYTHDYSEDITHEAIKAGENSVKYTQGHKFNRGRINVHGGAFIRFVSPKHIDLDAVNENILISFKPERYIEDMNVVLSFDKEVKLKTPFEMIYPGETIKVKLPKHLIKGRIRKINISIEEE